MKQVININYHGRIIPIEIAAHDLLKTYTAGLQVHFENEEGKEEIINDIEGRISELFHEQLTKGAVCITEQDVHAIIKSMGTPEEFETETLSSHSAKTETKENNFSSAQKRLFRDENNKVFGGVCSGLANYFNMDVIVVRVIFLLMFFSFGFGLIPYLILWIAVPSSATKSIGSVRKKLYRDTDEKMIAGVWARLRDRLASIGSSTSMVEVSSDYAAHFHDMFVKNHDRKHMTGDRIKILLLNLPFMLRDLIAPEVMCIQTYTSFLVSYMTSYTIS